MGVLITDEPEETVLDVRLGNAKRDVGDLVRLLQRAQSEAVKTDKPRTATLLWEVIDEAQRLERHVAELISIRGK